MVMIGIDVSKGRSTVAAAGEGKRIVQKPFDIVHDEDEIAKLVALANKFGSDTRVVMEHTGVYYRGVADALCKAGVKVSVVNPVLIHQFGDNTLRKVKTDKKDAMKIARFAIENYTELRDYTPEDALRESLKSAVREFEFEDKALVAHKNRLNALLERVFPGIDECFTSPVKANGHTKLLDFVDEFWHSGCVSELSEAKFLEKYARFCKKNGYLCKIPQAKDIHAMSRQCLTSLPKDETTKNFVKLAVQKTLYLSTCVELHRIQMVDLARQLPEFETVVSIYGVSESLAAKLIGEIGDIRRFKSKRSLAAYAGVDPGKDDSGRKVSSSGAISRSGDAILRKAAFQVVDCYIKTKPEDDAIYQFMDKKRSEGKNYFVYMTAGCNKFLRVYYARVMEFFAAQGVQADAAAQEPITAIEAQPCIIHSPTPNNKHAFTCAQDRATLGSDSSGVQGLAYTDGGGLLAAL